MPPALADMELHELSEHEFHTQSATMERVVRRWVRDGQDVEDIVQDTWLVALEQERGRIQQLDRWLSSVARLRALRFHRSTANQRAREEASARPDASPAADLEADSNDSISLMHRHIEALDEPYRSVLQLRYIDGLSITEISEHRGISPAAVRTQLHRARLQFKDRWERRSRFNGWILLLVERFTGKSTLGRLGARVALGAAAVTAVVVPWRMFAGISERDASSAVHNEAGEIALESGRTSAPQRTKLPEPEQTAASALSALVVEAIWEDDVSPASNVELRIESADGNSDADPIDMKTDFEGRVLHDEIAAGTWRIRPALGRSRIVEVSPGAVSELRIVLPRGKSTTVHVESRRRPLAGASVWVSYPGTPHEGRYVGTTDEAGQLVLDGIEEGVWLAARKDGVSSDTRLYQGYKKLHLSVHRSPSPLSGVVQDAAGRPIAGAQVQTSSSSEGVRHATAGIMLSSMPTTTLSDEKGRFELPWWGSSMEVVTSADSYLPRAQLLSARQSHELTIVLQRDPGLEVELFRVAGTALDVGSQPLVGWDVFLTPNQRAKTLSRVIGLEPMGRRVARTDSLGHFSFEDCPEGRQLLTLVHPLDPSRRIVARSEVEPRKTAEVLLRALDTEHTGSIRGTVGNAKECVSLQLFLDSEHLHEPISFKVDSEDRFEIPHLLPGKYQVICKRVQRPTQILGEFELVAGETAEIGELIVKFFGSLRVRLDVPEGETPERVHLMASYDSWLLSQTVTESAKSYRLEDGYVIADEIPAGLWRVGIYAKGFASSTVEVQVQTDTEGTGIVELVRGKNRTLCFQPSRPFSRSDTLYIEVWNDSRRSDFVVPVPTNLGSGSLALSEMLPEGPLYLSARTDSGLAGRAYLDPAEEGLTIALVNFGQPTYGFANR